jgi:hypothetical protein
MSLEEVLQRHHFDLSKLSLPTYQLGGGDRLIYLLHVPIAEALAQWERLRNLVPETLYWPVLGWDRFKEPTWENDLVQANINEGLQLDVRYWLEVEEGKTKIDEQREKRYANKELSPFVFRLHRGWFSSLLVPITLMPTADFWEIPAYLPVTVNEWDPSPAVHVAIMKYWHERWGAELVAMVAGALEMRVLQPPMEWEETLMLAKEQYAYSPDLVDQQVGSVNGLAKILLNGHIWQFWWD